MKLEQIYTEIQEGKQVGTLYHYTSFKAANSIIKGGGIKSGKPEVLQGYDGIDPSYKASISFTRDKNFHKAYRELSTFSLNCRFVVNGDALSNKYKIQPITARGFGKSADRFEWDKFESEEVILSKTPFTIPLDSSYIISFDVLYDPVEDLEIDGYKFIKTLKQLTDKGIKVNIVDGNGNPIPKELKVSFIQWLQKPLRSVKRALAGYSDDIIDKGYKAAEKYLIDDPKLAEDLNVGDKLFADIDAAKTASMDKGFSKDFKKWVEQVYGPDYEPNTPEEEKMFWALGNYFGDAGKGKELGAMVDDLKALKSQFPNMLNPTNTTLPNEGYAYRGAKLPIAQYEKLIRKSTPQWGTFTQHARVDNPGITYKSRGQYGFTSFTTDYEQAEKFANSWKEGGEFVNVVYGVKLDNPNLVVNPSFANRMSEYPEDETLYVGNSITPDVINIVDPRFTANVLYDMKAYEQENDLPEYSVRVADFYPNWAKTHTPRLEDFNLDGTPKKKEDKKVRLDKKSPEEQAKIDKLKALQAKKYGIKENTSLYKVYTEILTEVGGGTSEPFEQICKDLYEALNVGDKLWGAEVFPGIDLDARFVDFLHKLYAPDFEPNTVWEDALLRNLKGYFSQNKETKDLGPLLKGLLPLKSKFPRLLDPAQFKDVGGSGMPWESGYEGYAWRGATMPLKDLQRLIPQSRLVGYSNEKDPRQIRIDGFAIDNPNFVYKSRGGYGFTSFSLDAYTAGHFRGMYQDDRITVVYGVKLTDPNLIMNPDVSNLLSDYKEYETLYVGDKVKPNVIMVTDRRILDKFKDDARKAKTENPRAYFDDWKRKANITPSPEFPNLKKPEVKSSSSG